ncbi:MAG: hypothetical protein ACP5N7_04415 [Candidatus Pacearchaeota archaeon]
MSFKKGFFLLVLLVVLFSLSDNVSAQQASKITIEHISTSSAAYRSDAKPGPNVEVVNVDRKPTMDDIITGKKKGKKVTIIIDPSAANPRVSHAAIVVSLNITPRNGTNPNNETTLIYDCIVYDPTTNKSYNTSLVTINNSNSTAYIDWDGWRGVRELVMVYKSHAPPTKTRGTLLHKPTHFEFLPLLGTRKFLPKFN